MITYDYYLQCYFGEKIPEERFAYYERKARNYVNMITLSEAEKSGYDSVKDCICAIAEAYFESDDIGKKSSAQIGDVSVTYQNTQRTDNAVFDIACSYLLPLGLLSRRM